MGDIKGFQKYNRQLPTTQKVTERIGHFNEFYEASKESFKKEQAARCMDCGVPFCHSGCPLGNLIPDFNDAVFREDWKLAFQLLQSTNNFPEFTGRLCPAPCEAACVLGINNDAIAIEFIEKSIIEKAFSEGWVNAQLNIKRTGKKVAVVGSGPAGLSAADQLNKAGHSVTVFEKNDRIGGLLRYGIPDFKLEKNVIDRRLKIMEEEGINFTCNCEVGKDVKAEKLLQIYDSVVLCGGSTVPRNLNIEGRNLKGVHFAMEFLESNNKNIATGRKGNSNFDIDGKRILVIGGGDTGADCVGTSNRLGAKSVMQIELMNKPSLNRTDSNPWPKWPFVLKTSSSHEEGCDRKWAILTKRFVSEDGTNLSGIEVVNVEWGKNDQGEYSMQEVAESQQIIPCDYAFIAIGFAHPQLDGLLEDLDVGITDKKNVETDLFQTSVPKVFAAGDMRRGQSLIVWAIAEGREAATAVDKFLMGSHSVLMGITESELTV